MTFVKGRSGNPSGRPQKDNELKKLCKKATPESFQRILDIAQYGEEEGPRLKANQWVCEYAYGKAKQEIDASVETDTVLNIIFGAKQKSGS